MLLVPEQRRHPHLPHSGHQVAAQAALFQEGWLEEGEGSQLGMQTHQESLTQGPVTEFLQLQRQTSPDLGDRSPGF